MTFVSTMFHRGGHTMFLLLMVLGPALIVAIVHAAMARTWSLLAALAALTLLVAIGLYGRAETRDLVDAYAGSEAAAIREQGYDEANVPLKFALVLAAIVAIPVVIGEIRRFGKRRRVVVS